MLADKYEVTDLQKFCAKFVRTINIEPQTACEMLALADRFHRADLRRRALESVLRKPEAALQARPSLSVRLVREILATQALCINGETLIKVMSTWAEAESKEDSEVQRIFQDFALGAEQAFLRLSSEDALYNLRPENSQKVGLDCADQVVVCESVAGRTSGELRMKLTYNRTNITLEDGWVMWMLPFVSLYLTGFSFSKGLSAAKVHFKIFCSKDGREWHLCVDSKPYGDIQENQAIRCEHHAQVKWLKLQVLGGYFHSMFNVRGIIVQAARAEEFPVRAQQQ